MRRYEVVFVLAPLVAEDEVPQIAEQYKTVAEELGAQVLDVNLWGKRRLAYPIQKHTEGIYIILTLEEEASVAINELERRFKVSDQVIRFLSIRIDEDLKRAEKFRTRRDARKQRRAEARGTAEAAVAVAEPETAEPEEPAAETEPEEPAAETEAGEAAKEEEK